MTTRTYQSEFGKDFNLGIKLEGWTDNSWKNDTCPCFTKETGIGCTTRTLRLWVDFENQRDREDWDNRRYTMELKFFDSDEWFTQWSMDDSHSAQILINNQG